MSYFISVVLFGGDLILFQRSSVQVIRKKHFLQLSLFIFTLAFLFLLLKITFSTAVAYEAKQTVHRFYQYESEGRFSESWELFHSLMKEKFSKGYYIQDRAHVFMNHFGVTTFSYSLGRTTKIKNWSITSSAPLLNPVYKTTVTQIYKGKYGNFRLVQDVFTTKEDGHWTVLWDYNR